MSRVHLYQTHRRGRFWNYWWMSISLCLSIFAKSCTCTTDIDIHILAMECRKLLTQNDQISASTQLFPTNARIYIFLFDRSIIGSSPLVRTGLMHMCWSTFGSCGFRQILKIYFPYKALLTFLKYLQHRNEGLPKLIWSWNWLYVQIF